MTGTRVLWLTKGLGRGGAEMLLVSLARAIDTSDIQLEVAFRLPHKNALVAELEALGVRTHSLGSGEHGWLRELRRLLRTQRYDVVHTHAPLVGVAARLLAPRGSVLVHTEHNTWDRYHWATRWVNRLTIARNEVVWGVSDEVVRSMRSRATAHTAIEVMLHGVDASTVRRGPAARDTARERLALSGNGFTFATVGNLAPKKDQESLIRAFAGAHRRLPGSRLVIIGTGPLEVPLRRLAHQLELDEAVIFTGMRDDVQELLPGFDAFVLSSLHEGLSIAVIEALAAGLPVIATRVGGLPQLLPSDRDGILVPPRSPAALEAAMLRLARDQDLRRRLAEAAPLRAAEFGIQPAADRLAHHYRAHAPAPARAQAQGVGA